MPAPTAACRLRRRRLLPLAAGLALLALAPSPACFAPGGPPARETLQEAAVERQAAEPGPSSPDFGEGLTDEPPAGEASVEAAADRQLPEADPTPPKRTIVALQRRNPQVSRAWMDFVQTHGQKGKHAPWHYEPDFLERFLSELPASMREETPEPPDQDVLDRLKDVFGKNPRIRFYWAQHCYEQGGKVCNPRHQSAEFIESFLKMDNYMNPPDAGPSKETLRQFLAVTGTRSGNWQWYQYVSGEGYGIKNPKAHTDAFLQEFLAQQSQE